MTAHELISVELTVRISTVTNPSVCKSETALWKAAALLLAGGLGSD